MELKSQEAAAVDPYYKTFGQKLFLLHQTQGLPGYVVENAYSKLEAQFVQQVRQVSINDLPRNPNVISSHVLCKVKEDDDGHKSIKAPIAPHGNKDREKFSLKTDSAT